MSVGNSSADIDINHDDPVNLTPLIQAIKDKDRVIWLLDHGADVNCMALKRLPLAIAKGRLGKPMCRYPIEFAAATSTLEVIQLLLDRGASLEKTNVLHAAAGTFTTGDPNERIKVMEFFLEKGFDINAIEFSNDKEFIEQFERGRFYGTPLHYASAWGFEDRVEYLLNKGADRKVLGYNYKTKENWGIPLDWQKQNEEDEGGYSQKVLELLHYEKSK